MNQLITDSEINPELTHKLKQHPKYEVYRAWLRENGVLWKDIDFPVAFGPTGVVGVAAARDIPACSGIAAVPNQLLVTTTKVRQGELGRFIEENPKIFKDDQDADFNILSIFLFREKIKGKESFYFPMIDVLDNSTILLHWEKSEIKELDDPYIIKETTEFEQEMQRTWYEFNQVFEKYRDLFPPEKANKEDFFWCYEAVMTRCFGWSLPTTMLVPLADFLNHNADGTTHYIVNRGFEKDEDAAPSNYVMKKRKIDLSVFNDEEMLLSNEDKEIYLIPSTDHLNYIKKHTDYLSEESKQKLFAGNCDRQTQKDMVLEVNLNILRREKNRQIWELSWFESSDDEDNDTEEDEEEADTHGKDVFESTHQEELERARERNKNEKKFADEEVKDNESQTTALGATTDKSKEEKGDEGDDEEGDNEEEEEDDEDDEEARLEKDKYKYGKGIVTEKFSPTKYFRHNTSSHEKNEMAKLIKNLSPKATESEEENHHDDEDDSDWTWFEDRDRDNYFVVATHPSLSYKKGEQIFNCYGRRTNRFLLMWYGFCIEGNRYNSLSFRLWMNKQSLSNSNPPKKVLFQDYITGQEWQNRAIGGEENANPEGLTKEFRIKTSRLCEDVLAYLRAQLILTYKGSDLSKILVTIPASIPYEEFVVDYAVSLFSEILVFRTSIEEDQEILTDPNLNWKKRFAVVYRMEQKKVANLQLNLLRILLHTLRKVKAGVPLKNAYMEFLPSIDQSDEGFIEHRRRLANYLRLFYEGCH